MSNPITIRDAAGNVLSARDADGFGWDSIFDKNNNELSVRFTDGAGWDCTYCDKGMRLTFIEVPAEAKP